MSMEWVKVGLDEHRVGEGEVGKGKKGFEGSGKGSWWGGGYQHWLEIGNVWCRKIHQ
jgi:hypothetical protein